VSDVVESTVTRDGVAIGRATAEVGALTLASRLTGFARVLVVTAVLGRGALGDTYETANTVPNILFELFAAGALQAVLVPGLVEVMGREGRAAASRVASAVLGALLALLGAVVAVGMLVAPWLMRALTASESDAALRQAKETLGTLFLWFFLPQVLCYAVGLVATAVLHAEHRFNVAAIAPALNNVIVITAYLVFWALRAGAAPSLSLTTTEKIVLAGGTTLGVVAFTALPALAARRSGFVLRPKFDRSDPVVRRLGRRGAWAGGQLALVQVLLAVVLVLANGTAGGVVTWTFAFAFFLLPFSLFAVPVATTAFPHLARAHQQEDGPAFADRVGRATRAIAVALVGAGAALAALAWPIVRVAAFGDARIGDLGPLAHAVGAFAPGLVGYGLTYLFTRVAYARDDAHTPTLVTAVTVVIGVVAMVTAARLAPLPERAAALAGAFGGAQVIGAVILGRAVARRQARAERASVAPVVAGIVTAGAAAAVAMAAVAGALDGRSRAAAAATLIVAGAIGTAVYAAALRLLLRTPLTELVALDPRASRG
jgi:putative peptidoglycan lipid II flippase